MFDNYETGTFEPTCQQLEFANITQLPDKPWWKFWKKQRRITMHYERVGSVIRIWGVEQMWHEEINNPVMSPWATHSSNKGERPNE